MERGRQKGKIKNVVTIEDPLFGKYKIQEDDNCYTLVENTEKGTSVVGYYTMLGNALDQLAHNLLINKNGTYTLEGYIKEYKQIVNEFKQAIKL